MKYKLKCINHYMYDEDKFVKMLEEMALKGWVLESLSSFLLVFKKTKPIQLIYQIDYRENIDNEYQEFMKDFGYTILGHYYQIVILRSDNLNIEPIYSDEESKYLAMKSVTPLWKFIMFLVLGAILISEFFDNSLLWYPLYMTWGCFFLEFQEYLFRFFDLLLGLYIFGFGIKGLIIRRKIASQANHKEPSQKKMHLLRVVSVLQKIIGVFFLVVMCIGMISYPKLIIYVLVLLLICGSLSAVYIWADKKNKSVDNKKMLTFIGGMVWVIVAALIIGCVFYSLESKELSNYETVQDADYTTRTIENRTFYTRQITEGYTQVKENDSVYNEEAYSEIFYVCTNQSVAQDIFEELVIRDEHIGRYYAKEGAKQSIEQISRRNYKDIVAEYEITLREDADMVICMYSTFYILKEGKILIFSLSNFANLNSVLDYYI